VPASFPVSATCTRVPVMEAHTEVVYVSLKKDASVDAVKKAMRNSGRFFLAMKLPSCPTHLIDVTDDPFRPSLGWIATMRTASVTTVGRVRKDQALSNGVKFVLVSHNTKMGAAKGGCWWPNTWFTRATFSRASAAEEGNPGTFPSRRWS